MRQFMRSLPALLTRTDVVLELRDARLPLTSINGTFEGEVRLSAIFLFMSVRLDSFGLLLGARSSLRYWSGKV